MSAFPNSGTFSTSMKSSGARLRWMRNARVNSCRRSAFRASPRWRAWFARENPWHGGPPITPCGTNLPPKCPSMSRSRMVARSNTWPRSGRFRFRFQDAITSGLRSYARPIEYPASSNPRSSPPQPAKRLSKVGRSPWPLALSTAMSGMIRSSSATTRSFTGASRARTSKTQAHPASDHNSTEKQPVAWLACQGSRDGRTLPLSFSTARATYIVDSAAVCSPAHAHRCMTAMPPSAAFSRNSRETTSISSSTDYGGAAGRDPTPGGGDGG